MTAKYLRRVAELMAAGSVIAFFVATILSFGAEAGWDPLILLVICYPAIGAVIVSRQPSNRIGWLLVLGGASIASGQLGASAVRASLETDPARWQNVVAWLTNILFIGGFEGMVLAMAFLYPTVRALSSRWSVTGIVIALFMTASFVLLTLRPGPLGGYFANSPQLTNPFGIAAVDTLFHSLPPLATPLGLAVVATALAAMVIRFRRARGIERLQLQWFAMACGILAVSLVLGRAVPSLPGHPRSLVRFGEAAFFIPATLGMSTAIGIAILRYHLYDIDRLINRALVYGLLTTALNATYLAPVLGLGGLVRQGTSESSSVVVVASTLAVAALFRPLRSRIESQVDRRFYRRKYDTAKPIEDFRARLREQVDFYMLRYEVLAVVDEAMQPATAFVWAKRARRRDMSRGAAG